MQIQALEYRAHREIDRARQGLRIIKQRATAAAKDALRRERILQEAMQSAEQTISEYAGHLSALAISREKGRGSIKVAITMLASTRVRSTRKT